jgi:hypothetical protein
MSSAFETKTVNGIDVQFWHRDEPSGRSEARRLAAMLPRGGEFNEGAIDEIQSPIKRDGTIHVWFGFDGNVINWPIPDEYTVEEVSGFEDGGTCVKLTRSD